MNDNNKTEAEYREAMASKIRMAADYLTELAAEIEGITHFNHLARRLGIQRDEISSVIVSIRNKTGWRE